MAAVLIIEDDSDIRNAYAYALDRSGHEVKLASNAEEGLKAIQDHTPDVLLLDMLMPGLSGIEFLRQEKIRERFPAMLILVFSNLDSPRIADEARQLGADEYIVKVATTPSEVIEKIEKLLNAKQA